MSYPVKWYPFTQHPQSDSCWSLSVGPDGRIYIAACCECISGGIVKVLRYNEQTDSLDHLFDMDKMVDDPPESCRASQCKIHYCFVPSMHDGIMYMATHLSAPPIDQPFYSPLGSWHDPKHCFRGAVLLAYDTKKDEVLWWETMLPKEGCRCLLHDEERGLLYSLSYPRDHFFIYDIKKRQLRDMGRLGSVNAQALFLDKKHRVWTSNDDGHLVRYDPDKDRLELSPYKLPYQTNYQTGWHSVLYDVAPSPDGEAVYMSTWVAQPPLIRLWMHEGEWGRIENLGNLTQDRDLTLPMCTFTDHAGGLTFAGDGQLYYVISRWGDPEYNPEMYKKGRIKRGFVMRLNPETLEREEIAELIRPRVTSQYVSRGAVDHNGDLFFGHVNGADPPVGMFKVTMPADRKRPNAHLPIRMWG